MKYLVATLLFLFAPVALAFNIQELVPERPYDPQMISYTEGQQTVLLGSLNDFPTMYELRVTETTNLSFQLRQSIRASTMPIPFSLIVVKQEGTGRGVTEIGRLNPEADEWTRIKDENFGMWFRQSETFNAEVEPGVYSIEVSMSENYGDYMLLLGAQETPVSYFDSLSNIRTVQKFFGYSIFSMLLVPQVYYPLGIILLLFGIHRTWKYRKTITHVA